MNKYYIQGFIDTIIYNIFGALQILILVMHVQ